MTPIKYIGKRPHHIDGAYGTHIAWKQGETKPVPDDIAIKMLRHSDVYVAGNGEKTPDQPIVKKDDSDEDQDMRDSIANMDKDALENFAKTHFSVELDKRQGVDKLRQRVTCLIDQFGMA